jgi:hypothetical protein
VWANRIGGYAPCGLRLSAVAYRGKWLGTFIAWTWALLSASNELHSEYHADSLLIDATYSLHSEEGFC